MALTQVGENYNMPAKTYYCDTQEEFDNNFSDGDITTPGTKVYILDENKIMIKGDTLWGVYSTGSSGSGSGVRTEYVEYPWAKDHGEGF